MKGRNRKRKVWREGEEEVGKVYHGGSKGRNWDRKVRREGED